MRVSISFEGSDNSAQTVTIATDVVDRPLFLPMSRSASALGLSIDQCQDRAYTLAQGVRVHRQRAMSGSLLIPGYFGLENRIRQVQRRKQAHVGMYPVPLTFNIDYVRSRPAKDHIEHCPAGLADDNGGRPELLDLFFNGHFLG